MPRSVRSRTTAARNRDTALAVDGIGAEMSSGWGWNVVYGALALLGVLAQFRALSGCRRPMRQRWGAPMPALPLPADLLRVAEPPTSRVIGQPAPSMHFGSGTLIVTARCVPRPRMMRATRGAFCNSVATVGLLTRRAARRRSHG